MIEIVPIDIRNGIAIGVTIQLPKTQFIAIKAKNGYIMCGLLNIEALDVLHPEREVIAARALRVKCLEDLLKAEIEGVTNKAQKIGICKGMIAKEALELMMS